MAEKNKKKPVPTDAVSELSEPLWAVLTFESCAARDLTYDEAVAIMTELESRKTTGLCIVPIEVADRLTAVSPA